ncbi:MAG: LamG-like jellyroll fold domain-containing protein [Crocosphaera sp.]
MTITENFLKTYTDKTYQYTTLVNHKGMIVSLGMDDQRRIYYSVLNLNDDKEETELDVNYWPENPTELRFSNEISQVGYAIAGSTLIPVVKKGSREEGERGILQPEEIDTFLSSTARLTADAPFQALSDQKYIYIFRQSIETAHPDMVFKTQDGGCSGLNQRPEEDYVTDIGGNKVPIVNNTLLVDRFVLAGSELKPNLEVRYQRSRHKTRPQSSKDSLGSKDLEGNPFYEPTQELDFIKNLQQGRFSVLLLPTAIAEVQRWQIFAHNNQTELIDSFNIERGADGFFNTQGTQYYTSPDPEYQDSVFERKPGKCPFTGEELIPILSQEGYGESALEFDGVDDYIELPPECIPAGDQITVSFWAYGGETLPQNNSIFHGIDDNDARLINIHLPWKDGNIYFDSGNHDGYENISYAANESDYKGKWTHWGFTKDATEGVMKIYCNGELVCEGTQKTIPILVPTRLVLGAAHNGPCYPGKIDELRIWNRARSEDEIKADYHHRLIGNEIGLVGYWRFDEGSGNTVYDQTANAYHGTIYGATWVKSDALVGDDGGIRRTSFKFAGRTIESGLTAQLYYQQEKASTGYEQQEKPLKKNARVMLAVATDDATEQNYIGVLDFALSREGKLVQVPDVLNLGEPLSSDTAEDESRLLELEGEISKLQEAINNGDFEWPETKLQSTDLEKGDYFGWSVAISGDYAVVGAYDENSAGSYAGAAYIFAYDGESWTQTAKLQPTDLEEGDYFGYSVAISGDYAVVGAYREDSAGSYAGAAYIFAYDGESWKQTAKLQPMDLEEGDYFGYSVAISGDDAIVGAMYAKGTVGSFAGVAYIFAYDGGSWKQTVKLQPDDLEEGDYFGCSVAISGDDAIVGAKLSESETASKDGAAYIFAREEDSWIQTAKLQASEGKDSNHFGCSVTISGDYAIVGAYPEYRKPNTAYVFAREGQIWTEKNKLQGSDQVPNAQCGYSVAISGDYAIVGAYGQASGGDNAGAAYIFANLTESKQQELEQMQAEAKEIRDRLAQGVNLPMNRLHTDSLGLTVSGGLLGFASSQETPQFFDSAMGKLALYFRGLQGEFFAAYYDTNTAKAQYTLATEKNSINLFARSADAQTTETTVKVSDGTMADYCTVTIANTAMNITETWSRVPRQAVAFAQVLNGEANQKVFLTTLKTVLTGEVTNLELASPLKQALKQGDTLILGGSKIVGGIKVIVSQDVERKAETIPIESISLEVGENTALYWLPYDYESLAIANEVTYNLKKGSLLLLVSVGKTQDKVSNGIATGGDFSQSCAWVADSPGKAYNFDGINDYIALADETKLSKLDIQGDVTVEAWVNSDHNTKTDTIVTLIHHYSPNSQYTLALRLHGESGYSVIAGADIHSVESETPLPLNSWQHLAAVFNQSYGIQFNGGYLKCGKAAFLNISQDLTIEIFLKTGELSQKQGLISKGKLKDGTD